jgi:hypothetical protein
MGETKPFISPSPRVQAVSNWLLVVLLIALEFALFRHFLIREVIWSYPPNNDQLAYLQQTYELYEHARTDGLWNAIIHQPPTPQGALMQAQAAILFRIFGASRFNALLLNFLYFAIFQVVLVWTVRRIAGRWTVALLSLGLLLTTLTPFCGAGGIYDFRMDFIAFYLYGIFICLVIRSGVFTHVGWSIVAGMAGAFLICFRFVAAAYLAGIFAVVFGAVVIAWLLRRNKPNGALYSRQLRGLLICASVIAVIAGPVLWRCRDAIHDYYVVNHVTGAEKDIRAASMGTTEMWNAVKFYPEKVLWLHAGPMFLTVGAALILLGAGAYAISRLLLPLPPDEGWGEGEPRKTSLGQVGPLAIPPHPNPLPEGEGTGVFAWVFTGACLVVPLTILTLDVSKSPVVANVMVAPLLWLVVLAFVGFMRKIPFGTARSGFEAGFVLIAAVTLALGIRNQYKAYDHDRFMSRHRDDVENIDRMYDLIAERSRAANLQSVAIFNDRISDYLDAEVCRLLTYERHGYLLNVGDQFSTLVEMPQSEIVKKLGESDFAMISHRDHPPAGYDYPFNHQMEQLEPQLRTICQQTMTEIGHYRIFDDDVTVFTRRPRQ